MKPNKTVEVKLEPVKKTVEVVDQFANPGFRLHDNLKVNASLDGWVFSPGYVVGLEPNGAWVYHGQDNLPTFYGWENLCAIFTIVRTG